MDNYRLKMKILNLTEDSKIYTSNAYYVLGDWNAIEDLNTIVDVGRDPKIIDKINKTSTGIGKKKIDQVVLTHCHYDHTSMLSLVKSKFNPTAYAYSPYLKNIDCILKDGQIIKMGDRDFEVIYSPGHSNDSVCFYCEEEGVLFSGDTPILIRSTDEEYDPAFIETIKRLCNMKVEKIYFGHGKPKFKGCMELLYASLKNIRKRWQYR